MNIIKTFVRLTILSQQAAQILTEEKSDDSKLIRFIRLFLVGLFILAVLLIVAHYTRWIKSNEKNWTWICFFAVLFLAAFTIKKINKNSKKEEK